MELLMSDGQQSEPEVSVLTMLVRAFCRAKLPWMILSWRNIPITLITER
jgi:hypothetical protein